MYVCAHVHFVCMYGTCALNVCTFVRACFDESKRVVNYPFIY